MLVVLWALGWSMIVLGALVRLPVATITAFGAILIAGHNLFDSVRSANPIWSILHSPGFVLNTPEHVVFVAYPLIPWIGVTALGFALGQVYSWESERRRAFLLGLGSVLTLGFLVIRGINAYGDAARWATQKSALFTALSFLNTTKYPPSLLFLLMTLGPMLIVLWAVDSGTPRSLRPAVTIGKVPLFYYVLHFFLIHLLAVLVCYAQNGSAHWMFESPDLAHYPFSPPPGWGYSLPVVYLIWGGVVLAMYPLCRWFAGVKQRRKERVAELSLTYDAVVIGIRDRRSGKTLAQSSSSRFRHGGFCPGSRIRSRSRSRSRHDCYLTTISPFICLHLSSCVRLQ